MDFNSNKEDIINENYYEILNEVKSFIISDNPINESIFNAFETYGLINTKENDTHSSNSNNGSVDFVQGSINENSQNFPENNYKNNDYFELEGKLDKIKNINKSQEKQIKNQDKIIVKLKNKNLSDELNKRLALMILANVYVYS